MNSSLSSAVRAAVLTVSDRCSRGEAVDTAGPGVQQFLIERIKGELVATTCVSDDIEAISSQLRMWVEVDPAIDLIVTVGGTGLAERDVTPEATLAVLDRRHSALVELIRIRCLSVTPLAFLSRGVSGVARRSLIINLPGSQRAAVESISALEDVLPHAIAMLRGGDHGQGAATLEGGSR
jgi:molybdenum cofactor synthesis domain-containing protein